jgi:hypothetical protein
VDERQEEAKEKEQAEEEEEITGRVTRSVALYYDQSPCDEALG